MFLKGCLPLFTRAIGSHWSCKWHIAHICGTNYKFALGNMCNISLKRACLVVIIFYSMSALQEPDLAFLTPYLHVFVNGINWQSRPLKAQFPCIRGILGTDIF